MRNKTIITAMLILALGILVQACGSGRSHCNTKGKTRTEMGFM